MEKLIKMQFCFFNKVDRKQILLFNIFICFNVVFVSVGQTQFTDITKEAGINHQFKVFEGMFGGGAAVFDYNNDGFEDVFITGGTNDDILYKNNGNGTFTNVYEKSGLISTKKYVTQGATTADINRDGFIDILVTTITEKNKKLPIPRAPNLLFLNNRNGTFKDVTKAFKLDQLISFSTGASFCDINYDGYPDLYIGNYFNDFHGELTVINDATIVGSTQTSKGYLLLNEAGKSFKDVYEEYGLSHKGFGFGGVFSDYDNDGDQDLIVNHDFGYKRTPNLFLEFSKGIFGKGKFTDIAPDLKMDLKINSMGTAVGDYNNDGLMDYYFTNIRFNHFMVNNGPGKPFKNKTQELGLIQLAISWGANFADFDHDGDVDLFVSNGDLNPNCTPMSNFYYENINGRFQDNTRASGLADYGIGRGSVTFDADNDGDLDLLVVNQIPTLTYPVPSFTKLYRNDTQKGNWIKIKLKGIKAESNGIGARIEVVIGEKHMIREIDGGGSSHLSQNSVIGHFGIGNAKKVDEIIVTWPGGKKQRLKDQEINKLIIITESDENTSIPILYYGIFALIIGLIIFAIIKRKQKVKFR